MAIVRTSMSYGDPYGRRDSYEYTKEDIKLLKKQIVDLQFGKEALDDKVRALQSVKQRLEYDLDAARRSKNSAIEQNDGLTREALELRKQLEAERKKTKMAGLGKGTKVTKWMHNEDKHYFVKKVGDFKGPRLVELFQEGESWTATSDYLDLREVFPHHGGSIRRVPALWEFRDAIKMLTEAMESQFGWVASGGMVNLVKNPRLKKKMTQDAPVSAKQTKETKMDNEEYEYEEESSMTSTKDMLVASVTHGTKVAAADEASEVLLALVEALVGDAYPDLARTERGKDFVKIFAALGLHYAATNYSEMIPQADGVAAACGLVVEASARDVVQPELKKLGPVLKRLASLGQGALTGDEDVLIGDE